MAKFQTMLTETERKKIQDYASQGCSAFAIARKLHHDPRTVERYMNANVEQADKHVAPGRGRKRKVGEIEEGASITPSQFDDFVAAHREKGSKGISDDLKEEKKVSISPRSVRRHKAALGYKWRKKRKKARLTEEHKRKRLAWARAHRHTDWTKWVFSDEKTFSFVYGGGSQFAQIKRGEDIILETDKHPAKVHVWWGAGVSAICRPYLFTENMTGEIYRTILMSRLRSPLVGPSLIKNHSLTFQQDNDPKHKARLVQDWLDANVPNWTRDWPPNSPDLNPMENWWNTINRMVNIRKLKNIAEFQNAIRLSCIRFSRDEVQRTIDTMSERIAAVIHNKGGHTRY